MELPVRMEQSLPCPSQSILFNVAGDVHLQCMHFHSHEEVNVFLCLTCGYPVFRDDDEQESDLTSPFCLDCFSTFYSSRTCDDSDLCNDASITDMDDDDDDDDDHGCHVNSKALEDQALSLSKRCAPFKI